ncbi:cell division protein FtsQ/DivIB [Aeoliella mucimassa]|uniref:Cell division protein FtsQ n=1 Tax=Aeoliella mucimassa TaxID=2527972 RepID=A0A518ALI4_9BACT|nr:hypothetical protein [Aeoliella mucimassa]QDU55587.1 hypothetical protein Pan181_17790 [Aeoliella mucimassa]
MADEEQSQPLSFVTQWLQPRRLAWVAVLIVVGVIARQGWNSVNLQLTSSPEYRLTMDTVQLVPESLPPWIRTDVKSQVFRDSGLTDSLTLLDNPAEVQQQLVDAFELHPWIRKVERVDLVGPGRVEVTLEYREPIAVAEFVANDTRELLPVDAEGVRLPDGDLSEVEKTYLPRINSVPDRPLVGAAWTDSRMLGAVRIAANLRQLWDAYSLLDIIPSEYPEVARTHRFYVYDLRTSGGTIIRWGAAPGFAPPGESTFEQKLTRLSGYIQQHGRLDTINSPQLIDVRDALQVEARVAQEPEVIK